jgi:hypothetical protein
MKYVGTVLDLYQFMGHVKVHTSTFTSNVLQYSSCDVTDDMIAGTLQGTDYYSIYGTKTDLQIRSLISVVYHWHKFELA